MRKSCYILAVALVWCSSASVHSQDFLKQLEEKIFQKQQEAKNKEGSSDEAEAAQESSVSEAEAPQLLEPESLPAPANANRGSKIEPMELPPANIEPTPKRSAAPSSNVPSPFPKTQAPKTQLPKSQPKTGKLPSNSSAKSNSMPAVNGGGGFLGLTVESAGGGGFGLAVVEIAPDSPAWKAGFRTGDRVIGVAGQAVSTVDAFAEQLLKFAPGSPVKFLVERRGRNSTLVAVLQDRAIAGQIQGNRPGTAFDLAPPNSSMPNAYSSRPARAYFGVNVADMSDGFRRQFAIPTYQGASVTDVIPQSPAAAAGLKPGDCIVAIDGTAVQAADTVMEKILNSKPGQVITVSYYRGSQLTTASVPLISDVQDSNIAGQRQAVTPEMLTPEYVSGLHSELERVHSELSQTQSRLQELENRLRSLEGQR